MSTPRTAISALRPSATMCNRAAHACAASYRQRQRVPSLLSAPSEYTQHSGSRRRLPQASYSWSVRQDTQHKRKLRPPQRTAALPWPSCARFRRDAPRCRRLFALLPVTVATVLPPLVRRRKARRAERAARHAAQSCCGPCTVETPALPAPSPPAVSSCPLTPRRSLSSRRTRNPFSYPVRLV